MDRESTMHRSRAVFYVGLKKYFMKKKRCFNVGQGTRWREKLSPKSHWRTDWRTIGQDRVQW